VAMMVAANTENFLIVVGAPSTTPVADRGCFPVRPPQIPKLLTAYSS
jgi:hypothetical protein